MPKPQEIYQNLKTTCEIQVFSSQKFFKNLCFKKRCLYYIVLCTDVKLLNRALYLPPLWALGIESMFLNVLGKNFHTFFGVVFQVLLYIFGGDRVSLCCPDWPWTPSISQTGLELLIFLPQPLEAACLSHLAWVMMSSQITEILSEQLSACPSPPHPRPQPRGSFHFILCFCALELM